MKPDQKKNSLKRADSLIDTLSATMRRMAFRGGGNRGENLVNTEDVVLQGVLKKLKKGRMRFFVLHSGTAENRQPHLDYFENEKKWKSGQDPKRSINIRSCFNINKKHDSKGRIVLALYTTKDCLALQFSSTEEQEIWLKALLRLQHDVHLLSDQQPRPNFDHIWEVCIKQKSLGNQPRLQGDHRLCLTARTLSLVRTESDQALPGASDADGPSCLDFPLNSIRRCGHTDSFFFMELGRGSITGAGELWMETSDTVIAKNMHEVILSAMKSSKAHEDAPRQRSSSTSENTSSVAIPHMSGPFMGGPIMGGSPHSGHGSTGASPRDRSDSLPSRSRQNSEFNSYAMPSRCNTMDCTHVMHPNSFHWGAGPSTSPSGQLLNHSSLESCAEESSPHQSVPRNHLHINVTHSLEPQTIAEEQENPDYIAMNSPCGGGPTDTGSLIPSPVTLTDGGPSSLSSQCGTTSYHLPHQSSTSSIEFMKMSPTHDGSSSHHNNNNNNNNTDSSYMSMSPVGSSAASIDLLNGTGTLPNGYVPMMAMTSVANLGLHKSSNSEASPTSPPGYMEMAPLSSSLPKSVGGFNGSWGSSIHSLHETSPTFGLGLEGFHLEKVKSFIAPSNDADDNSIRTGRSYSVGKRPSERLSNTERVRAYSVGSQVYPAALAAKKRQQQHHQDILATPTSERGRSNSYSKKSSSATTLGGSRNSEEFMEINYDENWHRATAAAAAAADPLSLPSGGSTSINNNINNNYDSDYLPMRVNYKDSDSMKLFPVNEIEVSPPRAKGAGLQNDFSMMMSQKKPNPDYMDLSCGPMSPPQSVPQIQASKAASDSDGEYVSLDMSRPFPGRLSSNPICGGPEPKKSKSASSVTEVPTPMTTQHNYENLSFGANGATVEAVSSQEPMETDSTRPPTASVGANNATTAAPLVPNLTTNGTHHELNYAALDLPPACEEPASRPLPVGLSAMELTTSNPSGVAYSEVDFRKSEGLRGSLIREGPRV